MKNIAIIPARSGSKGLKDKNIRLLSGKPLIAYTIEAAIESKCFDEIYVSTDSEQYAEIARQYSAEVPFLRSSENATDQSSSWDTVREALRRFREIGKEFDTCALLQPTSPLRDSTDICSAYAEYQNREAECVISVCEVEHPVEWCFKLPESREMNVFAASPYRNMRRQELEVSYRENGAIYIMKTKNIMDVSYDLYQNKCFAYVMSGQKSIDIDTEMDFAAAEFMIQMLGK